MSPKLRHWLAAALVGGSTAFSATTLANDIDIYLNPTANPIQPPLTIVNLDLNLLGICNNLVTQSSNPKNPAAPQQCLNLANTLLLRDVLEGITANPTGFLSNLLVGTGNNDADRARALCSLYGVLGINSPVVNLPAVGPLLQPLLGGISALTCGTLETLLGIPLLGGIVNPLLGGFVGQLVAGLLDPLLGTVVGQLPVTVLGLLNNTFSGILNANQTGLLGLLESILNPLINTRVAVMVSHADRASLGGAPAAQCAFGDQASIPTSRRETPNCSNGAYFVAGFTLLSNQGSITALLTKVGNLLTNTLSPSNLLNATTSLVGTALTTPQNLLPPFQGKEAYAEITQYVKGAEVFNAPLNRFDGLTGLITRDTTIEAGGNYVKPPAECRRVNVLNVQLTNSLRDGESDARLASLYPGAVQGGAISFANLVREAETTGFTDSTGQQVKLRSFFLIQDNLSDLTALTGVGANVTTYANNLGLIGLGGSVAELLKPTLEVDASLVTPSLTLDLRVPNRILQPAFFSLFRPTANAAPRWDGNLKRLALVDGVYKDANGNPAIAEDGRIASGALSFWTNPAAHTPAGPDGRAVRKGGAGSRIPPSGRSNGETGVRQIFFDRLSGGTLSLHNLNANSAALRTELRPVFGAANDNESHALMLYARGFEVGTTAVPAPNLAAVAQRPWRHGAVLHSRPVAINYGARGSFTAENPDIRVLYGASDGFLRLVRNDSGAESWAFLPQAVMPQQKILRDNQVGTPFPFGVDGAPTVIVQDRSPGGGPGDGVINGPHDRVWAFVGLRRGGKAIYGLDLTNPDAPSMLWRITPEGLTSNASVPGNSPAWFAELALPFSQPQAARLRVNGQIRTVLVFGGGYNGGRNASNQPLGKDAQRASQNVLGTDDATGNALFIIDAQTGELLWKATRGAFNATAPYDAAERRFRHPLLQDGIAADVQVLDSTGDGLMDRLYVLDTGGRLWRGDFPADDRSKWTLQPLASVGRHDTADVANDRRFFHAVDLVPVRGRRGNFEAVIFASGNREDPLERVQQNALYLFRDTRINSGFEPGEIVTSESALPGHLDFEDLTSRCAAVGVEGCLEGLELDTGWRIQLTGAGEKALSQPLTVGNNIFLSTYLPPDPGMVACEPQEGGGRLYGVSLNDSSPSAASIFTAGTGGGAGGRARAIRAPGLVADVTMAGLDLVRSGTEQVEVSVPRYVPIYWRERRGEDEAPIPQPAP